MTKNENKVDEEEDLTPWYQVVLVLSKEGKAGLGVDILTWLEEESVFVENEKNCHLYEFTCVEWGLEYKEPHDLYSDLISVGSDEFFLQAKSLEDDPSLPKSYFNGGALADHGYVVAEDEFEIVWTEKHGTKLKK